MDIKKDKPDTCNTVQTETCAVTSKKEIKQLIILMERTDVSKIILSTKYESDKTYSVNNETTVRSPKTFKVRSVEDIHEDEKDSSSKVSGDFSNNGLSPKHKNDLSPNNNFSSPKREEHNDISSYGGINKEDNVNSTHKSKMGLKKSSNEPSNDHKKVEASNPERCQLSNNSEDIQGNDKPIAPITHESQEEKKQEERYIHKKYQENDTENYGNTENITKINMCNYSPVSKIDKVVNAHKTVSENENLVIANKAEQDCVSSKCNIESASDVMCTTGKKVNKSSSNVSTSGKVQNIDIIEIEDDENWLKENKSDVIEMKDKDEEEDVPGDFFDDFLKEDFMAGLDIVDEDDGDFEEKGKNDDTKPNLLLNPKKSQSLELRKKRKIDHVLKFRQSPPGLRNKSHENKNNVKRRKPTDHEEEIRKLDEELDSIRRAKLKKPEKPRNTIDADDFDIRRDPEKTKRDIQRDKVKCAKDREQKIINEKLSIVETGLVPPGMEMEVDIEEVRRQERIVKQMPPIDLRNRIRSLRSKTPEKKKHSSRSLERVVKSTITKSAEINKYEKAKSKNKISPRLTPPLKPSSKKRKSRTPTKVDSSSEGLMATKAALQKSPSFVERESKVLPRRSPRRSPLFRHTISPRKSPKFSFLKRSPRRRSPRRSPRSPKKSPRRSPTVKATKSRRSRSRSRRSRSRSPVSYHRHRISPLYRRERRRDRSYSPVERRKRSRSRTSERPLRREEKRSFLEELAEKLNATRTVVQSIQSQAPTSFSVPFHLPQSLPIHTPPIVPIAQSQPPQHIPVQPQPHLIPLPSPVPAPVPPPFFQQHPASRIVPSQPDQYDQSFFIGEELHVQPQQCNIGQMSFNFDQKQVTINSEEKNSGHQQQSPNDISMLFQDKKIRLSEFLAITAKPEVQSSAPDKLQEKIKIIQRCHEAINLMGSTNKKLGGRLTVRQTDGLKQNSEEVNQSPLLRSSPVRLPYTTPLHPTSNQSQFSRYCQSLLDSIGVEKKPKPAPVIIVLDDEPASIEKSLNGTSVLSPLKPTAVPTIPIEKMSNSPPLPMKVVPDKTIKPTTNCSSQTESKLSACKECEKRKAVRYANEAVQCGDSKITFSVSTQCSEADFYSMIPKTQSLANLTPAQLLGRSVTQDSSPKMYEGFSNRMYPREESVPQPLMFNTFTSNPLRAPFKSGLRGNPPTSSSRYSGYNRY